MRKGTKHQPDYRGTPKQRFWAKVVKTDGCWNWIGAVNSKGYGALRINGGNIFSHRFSYEINIGEIPDGLFVCHSCDNPRCVNPAHLWLGSNNNNVQDMVKKLRNTLGERNGMVKLTKGKVLEIRRLKKLGHTLTELASMFNIGISTTSQIVNRKRWKYI